MTPDSRPILTFDTTHHALWAEDVARENGIPIEVIPAPAESKAKCDLALLTLREQLEHLCSVLDHEGIEYRVFSG